jgi:hypothetical protein
MSQKRSRLSFRIPWLVEAVAEGPLAILALCILVSVAIVAKGIGWW